MQSPLAPWADEPTEEEKVSLPLSRSASPLENEPDRTFDGLDRALAMQGNVPNS